MNDDIFYLFTQAMDIKWKDTVEAIYDLVQFCIATENYEIWEELFFFARQKAQTIIDNNNDNDRQDVLTEFKNDEWLKQYIQKVKQ